MSFSFVPSKDDDDRYLSCIALHPTYDGRFRAASAALSVSYKPKVQIQLEEASSDLREGGRAVFRCLIGMTALLSIHTHTRHRCYRYLAYKIDNGAVCHICLDAKPMQDLNVSWQGLEGRLKSGRQVIFKITFTGPQHTHHNKFMFDFRLPSLKI